MSAVIAQTLPSRSAVLVERLIPRRSVAVEATLVAAGTIIVALSAMVQIPFYPVPFTLQTMAVLVVGAALGPRRAATSLALYMVLGVAGIPWFAGFTGGIAAIAKPTFGYIIGFIPAAFVLGYFARREWDRSLWRSLAAFGIGVALPFVFGVPYLMGVFNFVLGQSMSVSAALAAGLYPFLIGEVVKWLAAAALLPGMWALVNRLTAAKED